MIPLLFLLLSAFPAEKPAEIGPKIELIDAQPKVLAEYVAEYFSDVPVLAEIARCESHFRHFDRSGGVIRGEVNRYDVGVMQINELYHGKEAETLGLDLHAISGNLAYARRLFEREGTTPWLSSVKCWGTENHIARR